MNDTATNDTETTTEAPLPRVDDYFDLRTHNGIVTVANTARGTHRTFRIHTQADDAKFAPKARILGLLIGQDNETDYNGIGFVKEDGRIILWRRYQTDTYAKLIRVLEQPDRFRALGFTYSYEGHCRRCNRLLTTPDSVRDGIGPVCAGK